MDLLQREHPQILAGIGVGYNFLYPTPIPNFSRNRSGVEKIVDFRHLSRRISETVQDRVQVAIEH